MEDYLIHYGILGMKWGIRRFQNADGTLTPEGKKRYLNSDGNLNSEGKKQLYEDIKRLDNELWNRNVKKRRKYNDIYSEASSNALIRTMANNKDIRKAYEKDRITEDERLKIERIVESKENRLGIKATKKELKDLEKAIKENDEAYKNFQKSINDFFNESDLSIDDVKGINYTALTFIEKVLKE